MKPLARRVAFQGCHAPIPGGILSSLLLALLLCLSLVPILRAQAIPYSRPVETAPQAETIGGGYKTPAVQKPLPRDAVF
jgi:hypothetical protein